MLGFPISSDTYFYVKSFLSVENIFILLISCLHLCSGTIITIINAQLLLDGTGKVEMMITYHIGKTYLDHQGY